MRLTPPQRGGFTLLEIMIVVTIIGLLAAIAIPNFVRARKKTQQNHCVNNLRQVDGAKHQWALENRKTDADTPSEDELKFYVQRSLFPTCPTSGTYTIGAVATDPICSKSADGHVLPP